MRAGLVIQARMGSSRFPGKSLRDLHGLPLLHQLVARLERVHDIAETIVATSTQRADDAIAQYCSARKIPCARGSEADVLARYADTAEAHGLDVVIRVCGDAPLTDPEGVRAVWGRFRETGACFVHNRHPRGWPVGTAVDLVTREALAEASKRAERAHEREHVVPFLTANPELFPTRQVNAPAELCRPHFDLSVDYPEDLERLQHIYRHFGRRGGPDRMRELVSYLDAHPEWACRAAQAEPA